MPNYAIHDGQKVINVIIAESQSDAESISGMQAILTVSDQELPFNEKPWIGWTMEEEGWRRPQPFPSWSWNVDDWYAPKPVPEVPLGHYPEWNEDEQKWEIIEIPQPFPSWELNEDGDWVPPTPMPEDGNPYVWNEEDQEWALIIPEDFI